MLSGRAAVRSLQGKFRQLGHLAVDIAADYLEALRERPVFTPMTPDERQELLTLDLSEEGIPSEELLTTIQDRLFAHPMGNGHPRFFGWVNSPPALTGIVAEFLAATLNPSCAGGDHASFMMPRTQKISLSYWKAYGTQQNFTGSREMMMEKQYSVQYALRNRVQP